MSFLFETTAIPFWFIVFIFGSAIPLWIKWYKKFHKKFISSGVLQEKIDEVKVSTDAKLGVLKRASDYWNAHNKNSSDKKSDNKKTDFSDKKEKKQKAKESQEDRNKRKTIKIVLKVLAESGEAGILPKSISDKTDIDIMETNNSLEYLEEKKFAEAINGTAGTKYYLTKLGTKYCRNKKYI